MAQPPRPWPITMTVMVFSLYISSSTGPPAVKHEAALPRFLDYRKHITEHQTDMKTRERRENTEVAFSVAFRTYHTRPGLFGPELASCITRCISGAAPTYDPKQPRNVYCTNLV
ncbi:uncharacterized protein EI90DRAFT_1645677 [Cantharellus anzutake]|uniref:uncharacterized protein n=1 Tax=Cantharellus anzutake TaxID=1750568 RepID=UPI001907EC1A|nr:uncharacterized protein EI90DRAFT_1645677 [Cantharellus anzutake]KAF8327925.1 hypothetical protein EI90DRAFT_1645677 [Cantharellus anzutake]